MNEGVADVWSSKLQYVAARDAKGALDALIDQGSDRAPSLAQLIKHLPSKAPRKRLKEFYTREGNKYLKITTYHPGNAQPETHEYFEGLEDSPLDELLDTQMAEQGYKKIITPHPQGTAVRYVYKSLTDGTYNHLSDLPRNKQSANKIISHLAKNKDLNAAIQ
jgi:hypothetical protein